MRRAWVVVVALAALCLGLDTGKQISGTSAADSSSRLQVTGEIKTALAAAPLVYARCDLGGNIYLRLDTAERGKPPSRLSISEVTADGKTGRIFRLPESPVDLQALEYFPSPNGDLYAAAWSSSERAVYLLSFGQEGTLRSETRLQSDFFIPRQLLVFKSGEALVSGTLGDPGGRWYTPFTAVFEADGKLVKKIYEPEDEVSRRKAAAKEPGFVERHGFENRTVSRGDVALGMDGNAYLLRAGAPAVIFVISPRGEVIRKLQVEPPSAGLEGRLIKSARGRLAVFFLQGEQSYEGEISVMDLQGNPIITYTAFDGGIQAGLPGCYDGNSFTFMYGTRLRKAEAK